MADHESSSNYRLARQAGRKFLSEHSGSDTKGLLPVLDDIIRDVEIVSELSLGVREIPLKKVLGTRTAARGTAFAGNFMPLLAENTEFGAKWKKLYNSHIEEGIRDPIRVYEYINRYFVLEGNKRVSVLKYLDAVTVYAKVTRLIPRRDESSTLISIYYEFLDFDRRESFDNLWFSRRGCFTRLVELVEKFKEEQGLEGSVAEIIKRNYKSFRACYKDAAFGSVPITTGDAFLEYLEIYGLDEQLPVSELRERVRGCGAQFRLLSLRGTQAVTTIEMKQDAEKSSLSFFSKKPRKLKVAFAFESTAEASLWTGSHAVAMGRLARSMGDRVSITSRSQIPRGDAGYPMLRELVEDKPDILFLTSPNMSSAALRLSLENPDRAILHCDAAQPRKNMMTYFAKLHEAAYLMGVLAGAMTRTDVIGYMSSARFHSGRRYGVNAFATGARTVNPHVRVADCVLSHSELTEQEHAEARRAMAARGVDLAFCLHQPNTPLVRKAFPGVYGQLYLLTARSGHPVECVGAAALDWSVFYDQIVGDSFTTKNSILDITRRGEDSAVHFGWGVDTGIIDVFGVDAFMGHNATRLMKIFRGLVSSGSLHPFEGPLVDMDGQLRVEKEDMLSLVDVQNIDWRLDAVRDIIEMP